jgi:hypothetical protein
LTDDIKDTRGGMSVLSQFCAGPAWLPTYIS